MLKGRHNDFSVIDSSVNRAPVLRDITTLDVLVFIISRLKKNTKRVAIAIFHIFLGSKIHEYFIRDKIKHVSFTIYEDTGLL